MPAKKQDDGLHEIEFVEDAFVDAAARVQGRDGVERFTVGKRYRLVPASAARWVRRRKARYTDEDLQAEFEATR